MKNKNFCILPWIHLHTWPNDNVYPCCLTSQEMPVGSLENSSLEEIWNNDNMKQLRLDLLAGKQPESCKHCFEQESVGEHSFRTTANRNFAHHESKVELTNPDGSLDEMNLPYWDFRFSNVCNMRCRTCGPQLSTGWYKETKELWGSLTKDAPDLDAPRNMWEQIQPFFDNVEEIYFAGGEPLLTEEHYKILKQLKERKMYKTALKYNTNFSTLKYKQLDVLDYWPLFDNVQVGASLDGYGPAAEYIRKGTDWNSIVQNQMLLKLYAPNVNFYVSATVSALNAYHVIDFYKWAVDSMFIEPYNFHFNIVQHPAHYRIQILPEHMKKELTELYLNAAENVSPRAKNVQAGFRMLAAYLNAEDRTDMIPEFQKTTNAIDNLRNEDVIAIFPELSDLMKYDKK